MIKKVMSIMILLSLSACVNKEVFEPVENLSVDETKQDTILFDASTLKLQLKSVSIVDGSTVLNFEYEVMKNELLLKSYTVNIDISKQDDEKVFETITLRIKDLNEKGSFMVQSDNEIVETAFLEDDIIRVLLTITQDGHNSYAQMYSFVGSGTTFLNLP